MAGAGYKLFNTGDVLTAAQVNTYLQEQVVMVFNDATARTTALSGVLAEGMVTYLKSTKVVEIYNGTAWASLDDPNAIQNTIVDAKGDLISASAADVPARLAVGNNGETLVADSSTTTGLRWQGSEAAGKNYLINGGIDIWQRGTSFTIGTSPWTYTCDRWAGVVSSGTATYARESTVIPSGTRYSMKITAGGTQIPYFAQEIETANVIPFAGKTITFSAQVAASTSIPMTMTVEYSTNVDEPLATSQTNIAASSGGTATPTSSTFVTISGTYAIPSTAKSIRVYLAPTSNMTSGQVIYIGKLQFEIGSVATSFSRAGGTIAGELAACQRYYFRNTGGGATAYNPYANGGTISTTGAYIQFPFPVQMRVAPTSIDYANIAVQTSGGVLAALSSLSMDQVSGFCASLSAITASTWTANQPCRMINNNNVNGYVAFSAEL